MSDIMSVFIWWFAIFLLGMITFPFTTWLFHRFIDKGYIFTKIIGILFASYIMWFLGSIHILPFHKISIVLILVVLLLVNLWLFTRLRKQGIWDKLPIPLMVTEELMFFITLAFWSYVRATEPSIRGLEKFMDFGFVNSILRGSFFPPFDMWLTKSPDYTGGYFINYYYFGHYICAFLTKLTGIDPAVAYNLMIATLFAFCFTLPFSIASNCFHFFQEHIVQKQQKGKVLLHVRLLPSIVAGLLAAFLVSLGGNLHTFYVFTSGYPNEAPVPPWQLSLGFHPESYWYPNATRFIPFTIHEFPIYSFVVADLHGHVSDIPFVFLTIAILLTLIQTGSVNQKKETTNGKSGFFAWFVSEFEAHTNLPFLKVLLLGMLLAVMYMTNAWDGLIYMVLSVFVFFIRNISQIRTYKERRIWTVLYKTFTSSLFLLFFFLIANFPFSLNFKPFASGVGVLCAPSFLVGKSIGPLLFEAEKCQKSPIYMLALLWGFFYFNVVGFIFFTVFSRIRAYLAPTKETQYENVHASPLLTRYTKQLLNRFPSLAELTIVDAFVFVMIFISTLLLVFPEFFYLKDIYPAHYRANTMFKLGYQAFMMLGIVSAYTIIRIRHRQRMLKRTLSYLLYNTCFLFLFMLVAIYPYFAINSYYGGIKTYHGLYGLNWLQTQYPDDFQAILWLNKNIRCIEGATDCNNQPVIAEANGDSYTDYARVSANTGLPTIVGWPVHEWLWRGSYDEAGKRIPEVATIYESKDVEETKKILRKYHVAYIFLGNLEREKYKNIDETKLESLATIVFTSGNTKIYRVMND